MYKLLENGLIIDDTVFCEKGKNYIYQFCTQNGKFEKIKIMAEAESYDVIQQRLVEYCENKSKPFIALMVKNAKQRVSLAKPKQIIKLSKQITIDHLMVQLLKYNLMFFNREYIDSDNCTIIKMG